MKRGILANRKVSILIAAAVVVILIVLLIFYYVAFTTKGSIAIAELILSNYVEIENIDIKNTSGSLSKALVYQDIEFHDLEGLPKGNVLKIQRLEIALNSFNLNGLRINIQNGKLIFPSSDIILFYGNYQNAELNMTVYSNDINVSDLLDLFVENKTVKKVSGYIKNVDINIKGPLSKPEISGSFHVEKLSRDKFSMVNCPGELNFKLNSIKNNLKLNGWILLKSGMLSGPKTATVNLKESKILFTGDSKKPALNFKGVSNVGDVRIEIALEGTFDKPDIKLTSKPAMNEDRLMLMLATNKTWQSAETAINARELSMDLAKDFLGYFVFSGSGDKIAQQYGIHNILLKYDGQTTGIGATKDISDKSSISYAIEQQQKIDEKTSVSQKIGSEYKITENISIGAEKELKQNNETEQTQDKPKTDDKVMLKFKKEF
ncbi:MAG: translocation/assembly module TamB domain-containing protein [Candidatus Omnitrophota bacterium]